MLKVFLNSAVIEPGDRNNPIQKALIEEGTPQHFEFKAIELLQEAGRLRKRLAESNGATDLTLVEFYLEKLRAAATSISLAAAKTSQQYAPIAAKRIVEMEPIGRFPPLPMAEPESDCDQ